MLQLIYDRFRYDGKWPTFGQVDRPLRKIGQDPVTVIMSIPGSLLPPFQAGRSQPQPKDVLHLKIQGIAACEGGGEDVDRFVRLLPWLAQKELDFEPGSGSGEDYLRITSGEIKEFLGIPEDSGTLLSRLYEILNLERWGWQGSGTNAETGEWNVGVSRDVSRFSGVKTLDDYSAVQRQWDAELQDALVRSIVPVVPSIPAAISNLSAVARPKVIESPPGRAPAPARTFGDSYVAARVIGTLEQKAAQSSWNCDKLLHLIRELNDNYTSKNTYATHTLLRAILDHVPPVLGCNTFNEVASSYKWGRTDKGYIKNLLAFKLQGDDALHRQISKKDGVLRFEDLPPGTWLNTLLRECADHL